MSVLCRVWCVWKPPRFGNALTVSLVLYILGFGYGLKFFWWLVRANESLADLFLCNFSLIFHQLVSKTTLIYQRKNKETLMYHSMFFCSGSFQQIFFAEETWKSNYFWMILRLYQGIFASKFQSFQISHTNKGEIIFSQMLNGGGSEFFLVGFLAKVLPQFDPIT